VLLWWLGWLTPARVKLKWLLLSAEALASLEEGWQSLPAGDLRNTRARRERSSKPTIGLETPSDLHSYDKEPFDDPIPHAAIPQPHPWARVTMRSPFHKAGCAMIRRFVSSQPTPHVLVDSILLATALTAGGFALLLCAQLP
jgi:hypothetical protein